jgi:hypothetical protein
LFVFVEPLVGKLTPLTIVEPVVDAKLETKTVVNVRPFKLGAYPLVSLITTQELTLKGAVELVVLP